MENSNALAFLQAVSASGELREKALAAVQSGNVAEIEALARDAGLPAKFAEIQEAFRHSPAGGGLAEEELSDDELEAVAGGQKLQFGGAGELASSCGTRSDCPDGSSPKRP